MRKFVACLAACALALSLSAQTPRPGAKSTEEKKEAAPKMQGWIIPREKGGYLGLTIEDLKFRVYFYNAEKKPMTPDAERVAIRWDAKYKLGWERVILSPMGDNHSLGGGKPVRPPHTFLLFLTLLHGEGEGTEAFESYSVNYRPN